MFTADAKRKEFLSPTAPRPAKWREGRPPNVNDILAAYAELCAAIANYYLPLAETVQRRYLVQRELRDMKAKITQAIDYLNDVFSPPKSGESEATTTSGSPILSIGPSGIGGDFQREF